MTDPARSFGRVAEQYELGRPSWPAQAVDLPARELGLGRETPVLDLGAGTGKLTRLLLERFDRVVAVEPLDEMRALIPERAERLAGTAEAIPLADGSVGAVFCGESFHWFDWPRAISEIVRVLAPPSGLVLMWNRPSGGLSAAEWPEPVSELLEALPDPSPPERRYASHAWREALEGASFEPLRFAAVPNGGSVERDVLLARIASWSQVASLPDGEREAFVEEVARHLTGPSYRSTVETHVYWTRLAAARSQGQS